MKRQKRINPGSIVAVVLWWIFSLGIAAAEGTNVTRPDLTGLSIGQKAPEFEVKTVDGKMVKLSDYKGKYVLVDFWAVWCPDCIEDTPHVKATYDTFKDDDRFRMIGLSLDPDMEAPRDYARKHKLDWVQGFLGEWSKSDVAARYGVKGIPAVFLIGPDGNVVARDLRGEDIKRTVQRILAGEKSATSR